MKKLISILLLGSLCGQYFIQTGFVSWFNMNQETIVAAFCVNKDKPSMHCDGKCYLKKELKSIDDEQSAGKSQQVKAEQLIFLQPNAIDAILPFLKETRKFSCFLKNIYSFSPSLFLLKPPQL